MLQTFITGLFFDIGVISFFCVPFALYLLIIPKRFYGSLIDKAIIYFAYFLGILIFVFTFFAEITFWEEFKRRFNFIAVDYLVYTYEVVENINQSYPLPFLISGVIIISLLLLYVAKRKKAFSKTFNNNDDFKTKLFPAVFWIAIMLFFSIFISNKNAEWSKNRYENEISKSGIYSFFAAFRNNELKYDDFYKTQDIDTSFSTVKKLVVTKNDSIYPIKRNIMHLVRNVDSLQQKPNVILICIESLSASFMKRFGNNKNITPFLDKISNESIFFEKTFATGTRTIRGMEAIMLSVPPTAGRSIVKRPNNNNLFSIGEVFKQKGYSRTFFYGGDGYFDNMNQFFGGNGFNIVDRGRGFLLGDNFTAKRTNIDDNEITFENAWGVCDENVYDKVIQQANISHNNNRPFFNFIMTTSNHRPYTYPEGKIDIPSGTSREGAVKYTDFAIKQFIKKAKKQAWYKNTVFVIMSDHCASSAGKSELDVANYHIPALIYNLKGVKAKNITKMTSQIDIFPTLFGYFNWTYNSKFYGRDIEKIEPKNERALIGNYQKLGLLKKDKVMVLGTVKTANFYQWNKIKNNLNPIPMESIFLKETISYYQTADYLYRTGGMKMDSNSNKTKK
jgi:phosphoglycerol transferase MdoB-like AlkP superfamily enzyme